MAHLLLIASLVGARGAFGLASAGDLERMQMMRATPTMSRDKSGREFFTVAGVTIYPRTPYRSVDGQARQANEEKVWMFKPNKSSTGAQLQGLAHKLHGTPAMTNPEKGEMPFVSGSLTDAELASLVETYGEEQPGFLEIVEEDVFENMIPETEPIDPYTGIASVGYPWNIVDIDADHVRGRGAGVNVYVLDTGVRITHDQFGGRAFAGMDTTSGNVVVCDPTSTTCAADDHGHGTHCAGTVAGTTYGVADGATIWSARVLNAGWAKPVGPF